MMTTALDDRLRAVEATGGFDHPVLETFARFLGAAPDAALFRMSPLRYGEEHGLAETTAIDLFLHAAAAGVLDFSWGVHCPLCVAFLNTEGGLRSLSVARRCDLCQLDVMPEADSNVEVAFTVSPQVRSLRYHAPERLDLRTESAALFFSPSVRPDSPLHRGLREALADFGLVAQGATRELGRGLRDGRWVVMAPASHSVLHLEVTPGAAATVDVDLLDGRMIPGTAHVASGGVVRLHNRSPRVAALLVIPDPIPPPGSGGLAPPPNHHLLPHLTGKRLITCEAFHRLFQSRSIPAETGLELKSVTVLFTDLTSSTALYERVGDLRAFDLVRQHFTTLRRIVASRGGAVVKTIGDAIMASFAEPVLAIDAAVEMQRAIDRPDEELQLKIGLHAGPCIAVELNNRLDYFGRTVNLAARVQALAASREVICTDPIYDAPGVAEVVARAGLEVLRSEATLKGITGAIPIVRLR